MTTSTDHFVQPARESHTPDFAAIKAKQQQMWASGDFAVIGTTLQIVGESLCEAVDLRAFERVLDVACGNGNATLAAARRFADVTGLDYVPSLLQGAERRAAAEGLSIKLQEGDAEQLPHADGSFDVVLSTFGVMFAPNHAQAARQMFRVCRPNGGRIGLASWTPSGFIGKLLKIVGKYVAPPAGVSSPALWGDMDYVRTLFPLARTVQGTNKDFMFRYGSAAHLVEVFRRFYGPTHKAFLALSSDAQHALAEEMMALCNSHNVAGANSLVVPATYLEVVIHL